MMSSELLDFVVVVFFFFFADGEDSRTDDVQL